MKQILPLLVAMLLGTALPAAAQNKSETQKRESKPEAAQKPSQGVPSEPKTFTFNGGNLRTFISDFKKQLGMDLYDSATIDPKALSLQIPRMKIPIRDGWSGVLYNYNHLSSLTDQTLGKWVVSPPPHEKENSYRSVEAIVFMPPKNLTEEGALKVKAFSLDRLGDQQFQTLQALIDDQSDLLRKHSEEAGTPGNFRGGLRYHAGTGLLIASGGHEYVELAATIIEAYREAAANRRIADPE